MSLGRHADVDGLLAEIDVDALQVQAAALAGQMADQLAAPDSPWFLFRPIGDWASPPSDLVEWCRKARDILEQVARA